MKKGFIKERATYVTKNKLEKLILEEVQKLDRNLYPSVPAAKKAIELQYHKGLNAYTGRAAAPVLDFTVYKADTTVTCRIGSFVVLDIYYLKEDLCI